MLLIFALFLYSCVHNSYITTKDQYKKTFSFWQFRKQSAIRHWKETIADTTSTTLIQRSSGKRRIRGVYSYDIYKKMTTYNAKGQKMVESTTYRNNVKHITENRKKEYWQNYDSLKSFKIDSLLSKLKFQ